VKSLGEHDLVGVVVSQDHACALNQFLEEEEWECLEAEGAVMAPDAAPSPIVNGVFRGSRFEDIEIQRLLITTFNGFVGRSGMEPECKSDGE